MNMADKNGETALMKAVMEVVLGGSCEDVKYLIMSGADVNLRDEKGQSALTMAVMEKEWKCVELLIKAGADMNIDDD